jgi:hypothetical protein
MEIAEIWAVVSILTWLRGSVKMGKDSIGLNKKYSLHGSGPRRASGALPLQQHNPTQRV